MTIDETNATPTAAATGLIKLDFLAIRWNLHSSKKWAKCPLITIAAPHAPQLQTRFLLFNTGWFAI
jgi:hypothetical protein